MSFGAGMGAGLACGIGSGIAIGTSSGKKQAISQIRQQMVDGDMSLHDAMGKEVDIDSFLDSVGDRDCQSCCPGWTLVLILLIGAIALAGVTFGYFYFLQ